MVPLWTCAYQCTNRAKIGKSPSGLRGNGLLPPVSILDAYELSGSFSGLTKFQSVAAVTEHCMGERKLIRDFKFFGTKASIAGYPIVKRKHEAGPTRP